MVCEECKGKIHTFQYNLDEYVYKRGEKYFCGWTCLRKWEKEHPKEEYPRFMEWQKVGKAKWIAMGKFGIFTIEQIDKEFKARYNSSTYNEQIRFKKTKDLEGSQALCEDNEYWEW